MFSPTVINDNFLPVSQPFKSKKSNVTPGFITFLYLDDDLRKGYYLYQPRADIKSNVLFVTVHGISRNAYEHVLSFIPYAERHGISIVAPLFSEALFARYQKMGRTEKEPRADKYFNAVIAHASRLAAISPDRLYLFGYSGGAQFVHRYMMAYPERVASIAIGAAGWYTFPNPDLAYPIGIKPASLWQDLTFHPKIFLKIPTLVLVGEKDTQRNSTLRKSRKIDRLQGLNRLERGRAWIVALKDYSKRLNITASGHSFVQLSNSDHSFKHCIKNGGMADHVFRHFFSH